ncbi:MAG: Tim44/TimA family putative adaptor protein [Alphaproteobacteria bacterium]
MTDAQMMDILILAAIAGYLVYRFYNVLGEKRGSMAPEDKNNIIPMPGVNQGGPVVEHREIPKKLQPQLDDLYDLDPTFSVEGFLQGAEYAFGMIQTAVFKGDKDVLKGLVGPSVMRKFNSQIKKMDDAEETNASSIERIVSVDIKDVTLSGRIAKIAVAISSEQIHAIYDDYGELSEGDPDTIEKVKDKWTFERDVTSDNPNWVLVGI